MNLENMDYKMYYYNFEIYNIEEALKMSKKRFSELFKILPENNKKIISEYQNDFERFCNTLISKSIVSSIEYMQTIDSLIIINSKLKEALIPIENKYQKSRRKRKFNKLRDLDKEYKKIDKLIGAESLFDILVVIASSAIAVVSIIGGFMFLFIIGVITKDIFSLIASMVILLIWLFFVIWGRKIVSRSFSIDKNKKNIYDHTYMKSLKMKKLYQYTETLINKIN